MCSERKEGRLSWGLTTAMCLFIFLSEVFPREKVQVNQQQQAASSVLQRRLTKEVLLYVLQC